ncbi:MAG: hypothetical protein P0Y60_03445 [Candidatus Microbacterium colombiense]|nr:MAG: hypothetical protein P0Y60_03445 [Microbacterium sp.]
MNERLQSDLVSADPVPDGEDAELRDLVRRMSTDARAAAAAGSTTRVPWWRRRRTIIPLGLGVLVAATGAAVLIPLQLSVNDTQVQLDVEFPIIYTTDTGVEVSCRYGLYFGDPVDRSAADERLADFVSGHDWTGIGQRIYDKAIANPFVPGPDDDLEVDTPQLRDTFSFMEATDLIWAEIPEELLHDEWSSGSTMDCAGVLH